MRIVRIEVAETERELLQNLIKKGSDWRERERTETILLLDEGHTMFEVAEKKVCWRRRYENDGANGSKPVSLASLTSLLAARRESYVMNTASG